MQKYTKDSNFHNAILVIKKHIEKYAEVPNLEVEFRLGYINKDEFKTDIGKSFFDKISEQLFESEMLEKKLIFDKTKDYFYNGRRLTVSDSNPKGTCIRKEKLAVVDFSINDSGFDMRVSFSKEIPSKRFDISKSNYARVKERSSFHHKHLRFDMTNVTVEDNTVEDHLFEIELEIMEIDFTKMSSHYLIHDALLKINDMVNMCEEEDNEICSHKIVLIKEKIH